MSLSQTHKLILSYFFTVYDNRYDNCHIETVSSNLELFERLPAEYQDFVEALGDSAGDGNCGFRAISLAVFGHQHAWINVRKKLLTTFKQHQNVFTTYGITDHQQFIGKFQSESSPCSVQYCYDTFACLQVITDAFRRTVVLFASVEQQNQDGSPRKDDLGNVKYNKYRTAVVPFFELDTETMIDPIIIILTGEHFY